MKRGRWCVVKHPGDQYTEPWCSALYGGNGEHPYDCAYWPTWEQAYAAALAGYKETHGNIEAWL